MPLIAKDRLASLTLTATGKARYAGRDTNERFGLEQAAAEARLEENAHAINSLQDRLYAEGRRALLVVLQGIDTAGKDGTIRKVFNHTGPLGVSVTAFRQPSTEELAHDYLWRAHLAMPRRGTIGIFNRSHYEDVLIARVRKFAKPEVIEERYRQICDFERMLAENGTVILKFMLNISSGEQKKRLQERLDDADKNWKFNPSDLEDRKLWDDYMDAYDLMLSRTAAPAAPWHVIPADHKWVRNLLISEIVRSTLEEMDPRYPKPAFDPASIIIP